MNNGKNENENVAYYALKVLTLSILDKLRNNEVDLYTIEDYTLTLSAIIMKSYMDYYSLNLSNIRNKNCYFKV